MSIDNNAIKPSHYKAGEFDVIAFCQLHNINFDLGNVIKYVTRAGKKENNSELQDLNKAMEYLKRRIEFIETKRTDSMKITLITVGKIKEKYLKDAIAEYTKRLSKYCKLEIIEVPDEKTPDQASEVVEEGIRSKEGEKILRYIKDDMYVITLEIAGKMLTSEELAERIEKLGIQGKSSIAFVIGGSIGLGKEVLKRSDYALSFSKMTFPHQLMRVILLEQVYRSYRIMNGEPYHK